MAYYPASLLMPDMARTQGGILDSYSPTSVLSKLGEPVMYIVRHAEVKADKIGNIRGLDNPALDAKGEKQAQDVADFFADIPISCVVVDDLQRTRQTALPLVDAKAVPLEIDIGFRSWDLGDLEGQPIDDHEEDIKKLKQNPDIIPVGGISWNECKQNSLGAFRRYLGRSMEGLPAVAITHGSVIQIIFESLGDEVGEGYAEIPMEPSAIACILLTRDGFQPKILTGEVQSSEE